MLKSRKPKDLSLYLTGATASGKSKLALELAELLDGEIITVDSMQVYRAMDIGTDKPSPEERRRVTHHLVDILEIHESFDAGAFIKHAQAAREEILKKGKTPIFCGGTGMYFKAWLQGLLDIPAAPVALREKLAAMSFDSLLEKLREVAPQDYEKIDIHNRRRVERALEIFLMSGEESSRKKTQWREPRNENPFCIILQRDKESLRERIHQRVDEMFRRGLVEETQSLLGQGLEKNRTAMQAIGYRQVVAYLRGEAGSLEETVEEVKTRTRQFAKRQRTWFRSQMPYARELVAAEEVRKQAQEIAEEYRIYRDQ